MEHPLNPSSTEAIFAGDNAVLVGGSCETLAEIEDSSNGCEPGTYAGATFSLESGSWTPVEFPAELTDVANGHTEALGATSDGRAVFILGDRTERDARPEGAPLEGKEFWAYNAADSTWVALPLPGVRVDAACQSGDQVVVVTGEIRRGSDVLVPPDEEFSSEDDPDGYGALTLRVLDLSAAEPTWAESSALEPADPFALMPSPDVACGDGYALVHGGSGNEVHAHSTGEGLATDEWVTAPDQPIDGSFPVVLGNGPDVLFLDAGSGIMPSGPGVSYSFATNSWIELPDVSVPTLDAVVANDAITGWPAGEPSSSPFFSEIGR